MWCSTYQSGDGSCSFLRIHNADGIALSYRLVIDLLMKDAYFRLFFNKMLADVPYEGYFWEMPALTLRTLESDFECVCVESAAFNHLIADASSFARYFSGLPEGRLCAVFNNLGLDAVLISPSKASGNTRCAHLAHFSRFASSVYRDQLWLQLGETLMEKMSDQPLWVSTSGLGVPWLHIRIDTSPKYYAHTPYKAYSNISPVVP